MTDPNIGPNSGPNMDLDCDLVLPCLDEGPALRALLPQVPAGLRVIVADNGSSDDTVTVAQQAGAVVVREARRGYGAAVQAGIERAEATYVAVADGDGSLDPADVLRLLSLVRDDGYDLALGRRVPVARGVWPWHARLGNRLVLAVLRRRIGIDVRDIGPLRVARRQALLDLGVADRAMGYPVELLDRAARAGWRVTEVDVDYRPRQAGTRSKVSGSVRGTARAAYGFWKVLS